MATKTKISTTKTTLASQLSRKFIGHDVNLQRLQADQRRTIVKALKRLENKLVNKITQHVGAETFTLARNRALLRETREVIQTAYEDIASEHSEMLADMGAFELKATANVVNRQLGVDLFAVGVPRTVIESMLNENTVFGAPLKSYWAQQSASLQAKFAVEMRAGVFAGETTGQLIQRVRGTKAQQFQDGLMQTTRRGAEVVVRTSAQSILNDARMEVFKANADVLEGVQAQATLDDRTSDICMARSGFAWTLDGDPMPGTDTDESFPGPPPWHPNCRTTLMPVVKSVGAIIGDKSIDQEIRKEVDKLPKATQSSMTGQVAGHLTYEEWLREQPKAVQLSVLGPGRLALWEKGDISLRDLIDQRGNPLTLDQLKGLNQSGGTTPIRGGEAKSSSPSIHLKSEYTNAELYQLREYQNGVGVNSILRSAERGSKFEKEINRRLLEQPVYQKQIRELDSAIQRGRFEEDAVLYRGVNLKLAEATGNIAASGKFIDPAYIAVTSDPAIAAGFGDVIELRIPKGAYGVDMSEALGAKTRYEQKEFLLPRGLTFESRIENGRYILTLID